MLQRYLPTAVCQFDRLRHGGDEGASRLEKGYGEANGGYWGISTKQWKMVSPRFILKI